MYLCAWEEMYCYIFAVLDRLWMRQRATYLEFNSVLAKTREYIERLLVRTALPSPTPLDVRSHSTGRGHASPKRGRMIGHAACKTHHARLKGPPCWET